MGWVGGWSCCGGVGVGGWWCAGEGWGGGSDWCGGSGVGVVKTSLFDEISSSGKICQFNEGG